MSLAKFRCASWSSRDRFGCFFLKHPSSVHFCLMNLMMISQTAQIWNSDGLSFEFEVGERDFFLTLEDERLIFFVCYHHPVGIL